MFRFATPGYLYLLLLLPLLAGLYVYAVRSRRRALERFADEAVLPGLMPEASPVRLRLKFTGHTETVLLWGGTIDAFCHINTS